MVNVQADKNNNLDEGEVSLIDILRFLKAAWKSIALTGALGLAAAVAYLLITPKQYEASVQIMMAQIVIAANKNLNPLGVNVEEPTLLIARFSLPTSFSPQVIKSCGLQDQAGDAVALKNMIKLSIPRGVANLIELKTVGPSPQIATACAQSMFDLIQSSQAQIVATYVEEVKTKLADYEGRLKRAKNLVAMADKSGQAISASYLSTRDEIRFLLEEMAMFNNVVSTNQSRATRLITPIYAGDSPIAPKKSVVLAGGLLGGLLLGLLIALGRQMVATYMREMAGTV
ncbi:Wzz/FepE/Etk N-terminal domain-containing protein [Polynucleobacter sp. MWH-HuK1]|uniref:Wzz/FepE/Etk N-terminal domain-containing protein n=1 Tax=Polynucleobacter sp. MWH-HuK1 TaxID=1743158 RepID=UPI001C0AF836|nr:Wzz/FepE/Etk N-terminal domain-containing protein [Polynucleobacter sp. MWH-HuK1]MBU3564465.1 hypothetical protein [Polynucleobacter sp. MWH-HuK1]